jgi:hypothetical protein
VIDLARRDEKYLRRDGLSTREESLRRISDLNSQFVNLISLSTFERASKRFRANSRSLAPNSRTTTATTSTRREHVDNTPPTSTVPRRGAAVTIESPLLPRHRSSRTTTPSRVTTPPLVPTPAGPTRASVVPNVVPLPRHHLVPLRSPTPASAIASCRHESRSTDRLASPTRVEEGSGEKDGEDGERKDEDEDERRREEGLEIGEGEREREEVTKAGATCKPPTPLPTSDHEMGQENGDESRKRRRRCYRRRHRYCLTAYASPPTPNPGKHPPSPPHPNNERPEDNGKRRKRRRRQRRRRHRHPCCSPANELVSSSTSPTRVSTLPVHLLSTNTAAAAITNDDDHITAVVAPPRLPCRAHHRPTPLLRLPPRLASTTATASCVHEHPPNGRLARPTRVREAAGGRGRGPLYQCSPGCEPNLNPSQCAYAHCSFLRGGGPGPGIEFGGGI